ncbi:ligase-associated DNA damage response endonuclease PdeM [Ralstonia sp. CHL-2022]|uniref:Ligase-associated DNA damage response endonuclease PdeM n=1 Tax=Ralstonia mojiangensis TaxID=2953895 RepID=A0ABT2L7R9_9RALS|nr:ligase-associated DNA damage response endonuclease PdeM [Ralstonia mojiangensis]MCT7311470.1 ligase-associated DNA damage response endonuclease PdeM [Ralstonia mojiangensis]MCT7328709.1 ligase-associated DNA damage response endonuclease PdeM [Ralstonia mojiangensis]
MTALQDLVIHCAGETVWLLPERALWWPAQRMLMVADAHFGKAATFRARGVPVPAGSTVQAVARLDAMLERLPAAHIAWLGDLLHAREAHAAIDALVAWRTRHAEVACTLVRGNHDRHAGDPPAALRFNVVEEPWAIGPFALCHEPQEVPDRYVIAGHVHPGIVISGRGKDRLRLPCFRFGQSGALLPAFGEFTGLWTAPVAPGEALYGVIDDRVWPLQP